MKKQLSQVEEEKRKKVKWFGTMSGRGSWRVKDIEDNFFFQKDLTQGDRKKWKSK